MEINRKNDLTNKHVFSEAANQSPPPQGNCDACRQFSGKLVVLGDGDRLCPPCLERRKVDKQIDRMADELLHALRRQDSVSAFFREVVNLPVVLRVHSRRAQAFRALKGAIRSYVQPDPALAGFVSDDGSNPFALAWNTLVAFDVDPFSTDEEKFKVPMKAVAIIFRENGLWSDEFRRRLQAAWEAGRSR